MSQKLSSSKHFALVIRLLVIGSAWAPIRVAFAQERKLPAVVDLRPSQTPIRNQAGRDSCTYFPPIAALEAAYHRRNIKIDLSVEHLIWNRNETSAADGKAAMVNEHLLCATTGGSVIANFELLSRYGVSRADDMPYVPNYDDRKSSIYHGFDVSDFKWWEPYRQRALNRFNLDPKIYPHSARIHARYGIKKFVSYRDKDCQDIRKLEAALADGHEVAINVYSWDADPADKTHGGVPPIIWYRSKNSKVRPGDSHAMLLVGYDHRRQFFIVKNSYGSNDAGYEPDKLPSGWKDIARYKGYTLIHYSWLAGNREAAFIKDVIDPESDHFPLQRAIGLWQIKIHEKATERVVASAVLAWRRLPDNTGDPKHDLRVGDLHLNEKEYRVNARLSGTDPVKAVFYINYDDPQTSVYDDRGVQIHADISLSKGEPGTISGATFVAPHVMTNPFGVPFANLTVSAIQSTGNPLQNVQRYNCLDEEQQIQAHIWDVKFSPDSKRLISTGDAGPTGAIHIWDVETGKEYPSLRPGKNAWFSSAVFTPNGKQIVSGYSQENDLYVWNAATGARDGLLSGHTKPVTGIVVSSDGKLVLSGSDDQTLIVWNLENGKMLHRLPINSEHSSGTFSSDNKTILSYADDPTLRLWKTASGVQVQRLIGQSTHNRGVFSHDSRRVVSFSSDKILRLWDVGTGKQIREFEGCTNEVWGATFLQDGTKVAAWGKDRTLRIWETDNGRQFQTLDLGKDWKLDPAAIALSPDGRRVLTSHEDHSVRLRDISTDKELSRYANVINSRGLTFAPDGRLAASGSFRAGVYVLHLPE